MNLFDCNNILISMTKNIEHISVNTVRATFLLHKIYNILCFTYIISEATVLSFPSCGFDYINSTGGRVFMLVMTACGNFAFNWIFCVYSFSQLISLGIKTANW